MKWYIRALSAVLVLLMIGAAGCSLPVKYAFRSEPQLQRAPDTLAKKPLSSRQPLETQLLREHLDSEAQQLAYDAVAQHVTGADDGRIQIDNIDNDDLQMVINAFRGDHPEVFWLDPSGYQYYEEEGSVTAEFRYLQAAESLDAERQALDAAVEAAAAGAPDNATDYEIELYLNRYLADHCQYDTGGEQTHSAYGALVEQRAVCDGYSRAFQLLCRRLGVECTVVAGASDFNSGDENSGHMWNCVQLGDSWYHVDVTWNDAPDASCEAERVFYLNLTTDEIRNDHTISGSFAERLAYANQYFNLYVPPCDSTEYNTLRRTCAVIGDPEDDEAILAALLDAARRKESYCAFLVDETADFAAVTEAVAERYAGQWIQAAEHFLHGDPALAPAGRVVSYESKRVLVLLLQYESAND